MLRFESEAILTQTVPDIEFYYFTGWESPVLHYSTEDGWKYQPMQKTQRAGWFFLKGVIDNTSTGSSSDSFEFVISNQSHSVWDNPPATSPCRKGRNYFFSFNSSCTATSCPKTVERYTLVDGVVSRIEGRRPIVLATDLDGTLLGDSAPLSTFKQYWLQRHVWRGSKLIYTTGRNLKDFLQCAADNALLEPDYAICGVGTEIYTFGVSEAHDPREVLEEARHPTDNDDSSAGPPWCPTRHDAWSDRVWEEKMRIEFNREAAEHRALAFSGAIHINGNAFHDPSRLSLSVNVKELLKFIPLEQQHQQHESNTELENDNAICHQFLANVFSESKVLLSGCGDWRYVDILPLSGGKLPPLQYLLNTMSQFFTPEQILVCGDSGNDVDLFTAPGVCGCCVANAQPDLKAFLSGGGSVAAYQCCPPPRAKIFFATRCCAGGILEAMDHFQLT